MNGLIVRFGETALKRAILLGVIGAVLTGFMVVQAVTNTSLTVGTGNIGLTEESFTDDPDITVQAQGILVVSAATVAAGITPAGVELGTTLGAINNALVQNNYAYRFDIVESAAEALLLAENLKIEVYGDTGASTDLLGTFYSEQGTNEAAAAGVEGVQVTVDLGSSTTIPDAFDIVITRQ